MKKINLRSIICLLLGFSTIVNAQEYSSNFEKDVFSNYEKDSTNYDFLKGLFAIDSSYTDVKFDSKKSKIDQIISRLPGKESSSKKEKKRIKKIYNIIHDNFLKKYDEKAMFPDIFTSGNYNCVSASAIYAYVFDKLDIPYHVKEAPSHVYLIAYPKTYDIYLETTVPGAYGFIEPKESDIKKIIDELVNMKLVTKDEVSAKGYKKFYNDYFYGKEFIDKKSLIGMQYYNKGYFQLEKEKYSSAYYNIEKSATFFNSPASKLMSKYLTLLMLEKLTFESDSDLTILYNGLSKLEYNKDLTDGHLKVVLYKLIQKKDNDFINKAALKLATLKDSTMSSMSQLELYDFLLRDNSDKQNFDKAILYSDKVLQLDSTNKAAKRSIIYSVYQKLYLMPISEKTIEAYNDYEKRFDFIKEDKRIITYKASLYAQLAQQHFAQRNIKKGMTFFNVFEDLLENQKDKVQLNPQAVSQLYLILGRYYYGKSQFRKAKTVFEKGLKHSPDHFDLKKMLKWAKEDMR